MKTAKNDPSFTHEIHGFKPLLMDKRRIGDTSRWALGAKFAEDTAYDLPGRRSILIQAWDAARESFVTLRYQPCGIVDASLPFINGGTDSTSEFDVLGFADMLLLAGCKSDLNTILPKKSYPSVVTPLFYRLVGVDDWVLTTATTPRWHLPDVSTFRRVTSGMTQPLPHALDLVFHLDSSFFVMELRDYCDALKEGPNSMHSRLVRPVRANPLYASGETRDMGVLVGLLEKRWEAPGWVTSVRMASTRPARAVSSTMMLVPYQVGAAVAKVVWFDVTMLRLMWTLFGYLLSLAFGGVWGVGPVVVSHVLDVVKTTMGCCAAVSFISFLYSMDFAGH